MRISDWSADVCSSVLARRLSCHRGPDRAAVRPVLAGYSRPSRHHRERHSGTGNRPADAARHRHGADRKSVVEGTTVSVRVDLGGRSIVKNKYLHRRTVDRLIHNTTQHTNVTYQ